MAASSCSVFARAARASSADSAPARLATSTACVFSSGAGFFPNSLESSAQAPFRMESRVAIALMIGSIGR
ncbi:hypothetical protein EFP19_07530 [Burkholderia glumae]|nr:hypothetical protein EFP19_07530 [Burkholderia glumae]